MANTVYSVPQVPQELNFSLPSSLPSASAREVRVSPVNGNNFSISTSSQVIQFDLPCGQTGDYLDPTTTYVRFKCTYTAPGAGANGTDYSRLIGSSYSFFNLQRVLGNNASILEEINEVGVLANMLFQVQLNDSDKRGLSSSLGFAFDVTTPDFSSATTGHRIWYNTTTENLTFEYCVPLIGILGSGTDKMIPVGKILGLRLELTYDTASNILMALTANNITTYTVSEIEFVGNYIKLSPETQSLIDRANPELTHIRSHTYRQTAGILASGSNGTNEVLCNIRVNSLKSIYLCSSTSTANEGKFSGINPNLGSGTGWLIGGQLFPQRGLDPSTRTGDTFLEMQKSLGALNYAVYNGCIGKNGYYISSAANGLCQAFSTTKANSQSAPNQFFMGIDTEIVARKQSLLSGISTYATGLMFRANITTALTVSHTLNFYGYYDVILEVDNQAKTIISKY